VKIKQLFEREYYVYLVKFHLDWFLI